MKFGQASYLNQIEQKLLSQINQNTERLLWYISTSKPVLLTAFAGQSIVFQFCFQIFLLFDSYLLCILTITWVLHTPNIGQNIPFVTEKDLKTPKTMISASEQHAKHSFAGQNTQLTPSLTLSTFIFGWSL